MGDVSRKDDELVGRVLGGDLQAFGAIVRRYQDSVYATALRRTGNAADAEDVAQEAFLAAYQSLSRLKEPAKLGGWLRSVTRYTYSNWRRKHADLRRVSAAGDLLDAIPCGNSPSPDEAVQREELRQRILKAVVALPRHTGEVVRLYYVDGFSYQAIAESLSLSATTVKGRLQMGRDLLRKELVDMMEDARFKELLEKAAEVAEKKGKVKVWKTDLKEPLALVEQALVRAGELRTPQERDAARMQALVAKALYLGDEHDDADAQRELCGEALELARKLEDHAMIGWLLLHTVYMGWAKGVPDPPERVEEAAREFHEAGDGSGEGQAFLWKASRILREGKYDEGREIFARAREVLVGAKEYAWAAVADAAFEFIGHVDHARDPESMHEQGWICEMLQRETDGTVAYVGQPGYGGGRLHGSPVYDAAIMNVLGEKTRRPGETWTEDTFSYGSYPLRTTGTVVSDSETGTVPAGTFTHCRLIRTVTEDPEPEWDEDRRARRTNRQRLGTREAWYAPGVGMVKVRVATEKAKDDPPVFALEKFDIKEESKDWFPLAVGNRWVYVRENLLGQEFVGAHTLEVRYRDEKGIYHLSHCEYGYPVGKAAEAEATAAELKARVKEMAEEANKYVSQCRWDDAAAVYEEVLVEGGDHSWARMMAGRIYFMKGRYDRALDHLKRVLDDAWPWAVQTLGWCYDVMGEREKAIETYRKALDIAWQDSIETAARIGLEEPYVRAKKVEGDNGIPGRELSTAGWKATASPFDEDAANPFDGQKFTRWSTKSGQESGQFYQLDLGKVERISKVVLVDDAGGGTIYVSDYPRQYEIKASTDGENWTAVAAGKGDQRYYAGGCFEPVEARYIRIDQLGTTMPESWAIYGIHVYSPER